MAADDDISRVLVALAGDNAMCDVIVTWSRDGRRRAVVM